MVNLVVVNLALVALSRSPLVVWQPTWLETLLVSNDEKSDCVVETAKPVVAKKVKKRSSLLGKLDKVRRLVTKIIIPLKAPEPGKEVGKHFPFFLVFMNIVALCDALFTSCFYLRLVTASLLWTNLVLLGLLHFKPVTLTTVQCFYISLAPDKVYEGIFEHWLLINLIACMVFVGLGALFRRIRE